MPPPRDPCGWRIEATLSQLTPGGNPAVLLLEVFLTGTTLQIMPGIGNSEPYVGADTEQGWVYPAGDVGCSQRRLEHHAAALQRAGGLVAGAGG